MIVNLTKENFKKEAIESSIPVVIDFWAPWCGHCINLGPTIEEIAEEYDGKIKVCKINTDEQQELAIKYQVMSIPMCVKLEGGEIKAKTLGALPKAALIEQLGL